MIKFINKTPLRAVTFLFVMTFLVVVSITSFWEVVSSNVFPNTSIGLYNKSFWENVLVEAHGMVFDILIIGVIVVWLDTRRTKFNEQTNMTNELSDLSYLDLPEINHKKVGLIARLNQIGVKKFDLDELIITDVRIKGLIIESSTLNGLKAKKSIITGSIFDNTSLNHADISQAEIKGSKFINCKMKKALFINSKAIGADFSGSNLERAKFINSDLKSAILKNCDLRAVNFEGANLRNSNLKGVKNLEVSSLLKAKCLDFIVLDEAAKAELNSLKDGIKGF